jgi:hypothetical protein
MINVPGQRFTATHGIRAKRGEQKLFLSVQRSAVQCSAVQCSIDK